MTSSHPIKADYQHAPNLQTPSYHLPMRIPLKMTYQTVDFLVKGKVQGVYFRVFTRDAAQRLGVVGWVKNDPVCVSSRKFSYSRTH